MNSQERANHFYHLEQQARKAMKERTDQLFEKARRQIDLRIRHYPKEMRRNYRFYVQDLYRDMCNEDLRLKSLIEKQQLNLRLAEAYQARVPQVVVA